MNRVQLSFLLMWLCVGYSSTAPLSSLLNRRSSIDYVDDDENEEADEEIRSSVDDIQALSEGVETVIQRQHENSANEDDDEERDIDLVKVNLKRGEILICDREKLKGKKQCWWKDVSDNQVDDDERDLDLIKVNLRRGEILEVKRGSKRQVYKNICGPQKSPGQKQCKWQKLPAL